MSRLSSAILSERGGGDFLTIAFPPYVRPEILFLHLDSQTSTNGYSMAGMANFMLGSTQLGTVIAQKPIHTVGQGQVIMMFRLHVRGCISRFN